MSFYPHDRNFSEQTSERTGDNGEAWSRKRSNHAVRFCEGSFCPNWKVHNAISYMCRWEGICVESQNKYERQSESEVDGSHSDSVLGAVLPLSARFAKWLTFSPIPPSSSTVPNTPFPRSRGGFQRCFVSTEWIISWRLYWEGEHGKWSPQSNKRHKS